MTNSCSSITTECIQVLELPPEAIQEVVEIPSECGDQYIPIEETAWIDAAKNYGAETITLNGLHRGAATMVRSTGDLVDGMMPLDDWLLSNGMGVDRENILVGKLALYGGAILIAAIFLPGWILLGVMVVGLTASMIHYGQGFHHYRYAQTGAERNLAIQRGEEAFAEIAIGATLLGASQGIPALANTRWIPISPNIAGNIQTMARAVCLTDDPYFVQQTAKQAIQVATLP